MKKYLLFLLIILIFIFPLSSLSQSASDDGEEVSIEEIKSEIQHMLYPLDKSKITSGLLSEYGIYWIDLSLFNGILSDSVYSNPSVWLQLYRGIYDSRINNNISLESPESVSNKFKGMNLGDGAIPFGIIHYQYDTFDDEAVNKEWLKYENGQLFEIAGKPSPYIKKDLFAIAPQKNIFDGKNLSFMFKPELLYTNLSKTIQKLEVKFDNESGYHTAVWNSVVSHTFASIGRKSIYFKITYIDGTVFSGQTAIFIKEPPATQAPQASLIDARVNIPATASHSGGTMEIHYSIHNTSGILKKPLIIAEPFDMGEVLSLVNKYDLDEIISRDNNLRKILDDYLDYDIVYLNYNSSLDDILRNAALMKEAIRKVNEIKDKTVNNPNIVIGISMGGLVARYALRSMEIAKEDHDTWKYISLDAPHKGANFPLGVQCFLLHVGELYQKYADKMGDELSIINELLNVLNSKAAKQMLIYSNGNSFHSDFQNEYDRIGFPVKCQNIAIAGGSSKGSPIFPSGQLILNHSIDNYVEFFSFMLSIFGTQADISFGADLRFKMKIQAIGAGEVYYGRLYLEKKIIWTITHTLSRKSKSDIGLLPIDGIAGSFNGFDDIKVDNNLVKTIFEKMIVKKFTFVPTPSALAISNWKDYLNKDIRNIDFFAEGLTRFEQWYMPADNHKHGDFTFAPEFLAQHVASPPVLMDYEAPSICSGTLIRLKNPSNVPITWEASTNFTLVDANNTSVRISAMEANIYGVLSAKQTITIPANLASLAKIPSTFTMQHRKRFISQCDMSVIGWFWDRTARITLSLPYLPQGTPISWSITEDNTSSFRIVSAAADSVVVEALAYGKTAKIKAVANLDQLYIIERNISGPSLIFYPPEYLNCQGSAITPEVLLPNIRTIEWSVWGNERYADILDGTNSPTVIVQGIKNTLNRLANLKVSVTTDKGESFSYTANSVRVGMPEKLSVSAYLLERTGVEKKVLIRALPDTYGPGLSYQWSTTSGTIKPCVSASVIDTQHYTNSDFEQIAEEMYIAKALEETNLSEDMKKAIQQETETGNAEVKQSAAVIQNDQVEYIILEIAERITNQAGEEETKIYYVKVVNPERPITITTGATPGKPMNPLPAIPDNDPSYAVLTYAGGDVTAKCRLRTPCNQDLIATVTISGADFSCYYTSGSNAIVINNISESGNGNYNQGTGNYTFEGEFHNYNIYIYNDYGLVKTSQINSGEEHVTISMAGLPAGYYYINIVDESGYVVKRQTISTY